MAIGRHDRVTAAALGITLLGWTLFWARALSLVMPFPIWLPALVFFAGLALIPFRQPGPPGAETLLKERR